MKLLVTGAGGMLGHSLVRLAAARHEIWGIYRSFRPSVPIGKALAVDLTDGFRLKEHLRAVRPDAIAHTAAMTDVEECEKDPVRAKRINAEVTKELASMATGLGSRFVYISTDYVFDGKKGRYRETDSPNPLNVYGETKLLGEEAARSSCPDCLVLRTSIFGFNLQVKTGLVEYVMQSLTEGKPITRFPDQFSTPIYTGDLSRWILELLDRRVTGMFHVGGRERVSRYDFAVKVAEIFSLPREIIRPVPFGLVEGLAARPRDSSLCGEKVEAVLGRELPGTAEGLERLRSDYRMQRPLEEK